MLISLGNAKRERSLKRHYEIVEKNLAKVNCRTRAEFEKGLTSWTRSTCVPRVCGAEAIGLPASLLLFGCSPRVRG
jgi:hypothetical protein